MLCRQSLVLAPILLIAALGSAAEQPRLDPHGDALPDEARLRLGSSRFRSEGSGSPPALSPDGKRIALTWHTGIILLDATSGKEVERFTFPNAAGSQSATFSPDGKLLAVAGFQGIQVLDAHSGKVVGTLATSDRGSGMRSISFSADGSRIAVGAQNYNVKLQATVWDTDGFKKLHALDVLQDRTVSVSLSADGKSLATWGQYGGGGNPDNPRTVQLWDVATGKETKKVVAESYVSVAALSHDGKQLALVDGAAVAVWDVEAGKIAHRLAARRGIVQLQYSPDGKLLAASSRDGAAQLWDVPAYTRRGKAAGPPESPPIPSQFGPSLAFLPDGTVRAVAGSLPGLHLWEVPSGRVFSPQDAHTGPVVTLGFSADSRKVLSGAVDGLRIWDAATGKFERRLELRDPNDSLRGGLPQQFLLAPDTRSVLVGTQTAGLRVMDLATEQEQFAVDSALGNPGLSAAYSADGKTLAVAGSVFVNPNRSSVVHVWDVAAGRERATFKAKVAQVHQVAVAVSADGKAVLTAINGTGGALVAGQTIELTLWDVATGKERWTKPAGAWMTQVAFAPDGEWVVVAGQNGVQMYDAVAGTELLQFEAAGGMQFMSLALSPDGRTLAAAGRAINPQEPTGVVRVWETSTGKVRAEYAGHRQPVTALAFAPDGRTLASGSQDTTVVLWDLTGRLAPAAPALARPKPGDFDALWADLDSTDSRKAFRLIQALAAHPAEAAALVRAKLPPVQGKRVTAAEIDKLIVDLDHDEFDRREAASKALAELGKTAAPALTAALKGQSSPEKKKRVEDLLEALKATGPGREMVRPTRGMELLERLGSAEARGVLEELAKGNPDAPVTRQAKASLQRLNAP
jgi:WD40 repeat protein